MEKNKIGDYIKKKSIWADEIFLLFLYGGKNERRKTKMPFGRTL